MCSMSRKSFSKLRRSLSWARQSQTAQRTAISHVLARTY